MQNHHINGNNNNAQCPVYHYDIIIYNVVLFIYTVVQCGMYGNNAPDAFSGNVWSRLLLLSSSSHSNAYNCKRQRQIKYLHEQIMRQTTAALTEHNI